MSHTKQLHRPGCWRAFLLTAVCLQLPLASLHAQKAAPKPEPKYDLQTETQIKGTVEELKVPDKAKENMHVILKSTDASIDITLCPKSYLDDMGISLAKGDEIALLASKIKDDAGEVVLARELKKGNDTLILRDAKGNPVWNWRR